MLPNDIFSPIVSPINNKNRESAMALIYSLSEAESENLKNDLKLESQILQDMDILSFTPAPQITGINLHNSEANGYDSAGCHVLEIDDIVKDLGLPQTLQASLLKKRRNFN